MHDFVNSYTFKNQCYSEAKYDQLQLPIVFSFTKYLFLYFAGRNESDLMIVYGKTDNDSLAPFSVSVNQPNVSIVHWMYKGQQQQPWEFWVSQWL